MSSIKRVGHVRWEWLHDGTWPEREFGPAITERLTQDASINEALLLYDSDLVIDRTFDRWKLIPIANGNYERYIAKWIGAPGLSVIWDYYQAIAKHLLDLPIPTHR
jgi:hypothetical protein